MRRLLLLALGAAIPAFANDAEVVARMGDITLTRQEVRRLADQFPREAATAAGLERLARVELVRRGVAAEARKQGFDQRPEVAERMRRAAEAALVSAYVNQLARPPSDYPSETQIREAYEANKVALLGPRRFRLSQIYVAGTDDRARRQAEDLRRQATRKGADFAGLARKSSQHPASAAQGGDMGWLAERDLLPAVAKAASALKKGEVSEVVAGAEGFHILRLADRKEPEIPGLEQVREALTESLRLRRAQEIEAAYLDGLMARTPIAVNGLALGEMVRK